MAQMGEIWIKIWLRYKILLKFLLGFIAFRFKNMIYTIP